MTWLAEHAKLRTALQTTLGAETGGVDAGSTGTDAGDAQGPSGWVDLGNAPPTEREPAARATRILPETSMVVVRVPAAGEMFAGRYLIERVLGKGGMGVVLAARHIHLAQRVAVKLITHETPTPAAVERFLREGRAAAALTNPNIAKVLDMGQTDERTPYIVLEYLTGENAAAMLLRDGPMPIGLAVSVVLQACVGIAEAHARGIVHRDLKPANLFLTTDVDGSLLVKVVDFGISKVSLPSAPKDDSLTQAGVPMGSPMYMSPEQICSAKDVDARSDIWSLGIILYELIAGAVPFKGETFAHTYTQILEAECPRLRVRRADAPPELEGIVDMCLARDPETRFRDVGALATALAPWTNEGPRLAERVRRTLLADLQEPRSWQDDASRPGELADESSSGARASAQNRRRNARKWIVPLAFATTVGLLAVVAMKVRSEYAQHNVDLVNEAHAAAALPVAPSPSSEPLARPMAVTAPTMRSDETKPSGGPSSQPPAVPGQALTLANPALIHAGPPLDSVTKAALASPHVDAVSTGASERRASVSRVSPEHEPSPSASAHTLARHETDIF